MANRKCEHGREKTRCIDCGGGNICDHDRIRGNCPVCSPEQSFVRYQKQAKQRNFSFGLTLSQFEQIVQAACAFCGKTPALGVDRKDNRIGYLASNVQACCARCNRYKSNDPELVFLGHVRKIAQHQEKIRAKLLVEPAAVS